MTVADHIAAFLAEKGVTHAFGIIGAGNAALFDAIRRAQKTEIVCCHHEAAAVMAAGGYARVRAPCVGVSIVTTGAGSSNAVTGALAALMDSVPVLIISGNEPMPYMKLDRLQTRVVGVQGFHASAACNLFVKKMEYVLSAGLIETYLQSAHREATEGRPGPAWIDIPRDKFNAMV